MESPHGHCRLRSSSCPLRFPGAAGIRFWEIIAGGSSCRDTLVDLEMLAQDADHVAGYGRRAGGPRRVSLPARDLKRRQGWQRHADPVLVDPREIAVVVVEPDRRVDPAQEIRLAAAHAGGVEAAPPDELALQALIRLAQDQR